MQPNLRLEDRPTQEIKAVLEIASQQLPAAQVLALQEFLLKVGGLQNAQAAVQMLEDLERAA